MTGNKLKEALERLGYPVTGPDKSGEFHSPCPLCGGTDRFRFLDDKINCRQCMSGTIEQNNTRRKEIWGILRLNNNSKGNGKAPPPPAPPLPPAPQEGDKHRQKLSLPFGREDEYKYFNEKREHVLTVVRMPKKDGKKAFFQYRPAPASNGKYYKGGLIRNPLYNLLGLVSDPETPVLVVEGEEGSRPSQGGPAGLVCHYMGRRSPGVEESRVGNP